MLQADLLIEVFIHLLSIYLQNVDFKGSRITWIICSPVLKAPPNLRFEVATMDLLVAILCLDLARYASEVEAFDLF